MTHGWRSLLRVSCSWLLCLLVVCSLPLTAGGQEPAPINENGAAQIQDAATATANNNNNNNVKLDVFDLLDRNHDGRMDRREFNQAVDQFEDFLRHHPGAERTSWFARPSVVRADGAPKKDLSFWNGFTSAVAMILATEIGDKTFFIAAVLSMKQDRRCIFGGAILALILMTILSTLMGLLLPQFLDRKYTHLLAGALFGYFGVKLVYDSRSMASHKVSEELDEVEEELLHQNKKSDAMDDSCTSDNNSEEELAGGKVDVENPMRNRSNAFSSPNSSKQNSSVGNTSVKKKHKKKHRKQQWHMILLQSFTLTFVAEWGDRSQIATIALAAAKNPYGVTVGGCVGHSMCTGLAVLGGRMLAARISEKTVSQWGGILFLVFGIHSLFFES